MLCLSIYERIFTSEKTGAWVYLINRYDLTPLYAPLPRLAVEGKKWLNILRLFAIMAWLWRVFIS